MTKTALLIVCLVLISFDWVKPLTRQYVLEDLKDESFPLL
jgi:hypothetical protein